MLPGLVVPFRRSFIFWKHALYRSSQISYLTRSNDYLEGFRKLLNLKQSSTKNKYHLPLIRVVQVDMYVSESV
jgi:hypothetical protein